MNFEQLPFATIDHLRPITQGHQEVIFCPGKTVGQVVAIAERLEVAGGSFLATRADSAQAEALAARFPRVEINELGRTAYLPPDPEPPPTGRGTVLVCTAGTRCCGRRASSSWSPEWKARSPVWWAGWSKSR